MSHIAGWRSRLLQIHPDHLRIARSAVWVSLFALIGKCAGAFKEMAIAYRYGISNIVDAYQLTLTLITWLPATLVAVVSVVLVPTLVELRSRNKEEQARFLGELDVMAILVGVFFAVLLYFCWPFALELMARNLSEETRVISRRMMLGMTPIGILMLTICVHAARLQAGKSMSTRCWNVFPPSFCLSSCWGGASQLARALDLGHDARLRVPGGDIERAFREADGVRARFSLSLRSPQWPHMYRAVGVFMIGQFIMSLATPLDQYFVAGLGDGAIATLGYASRVTRADRQHGRRGDQPGDLAGFIRAIECRRSRSRTKHRAKVVAPHAGIGSVVAVVAWYLAPFGVACCFSVAPSALRIPSRWPASFVGACSRCLFISPCWCWSAFRERRPLQGNGFRRGGQFRGQGACQFHPDSVVRHTGVSSQPA